MYIYIYILFTYLFCTVISNTLNLKATFFSIILKTLACNNILEQDGLTNTIEIKNKI